MNRHILLVILLVGAGCPRLTTQEDINAIAEELKLSQEQLDSNSPEYVGEDVVELIAFCAATNNDRAPEPPPWPLTTTPLPDVCDEAVRIADVVAACGPLAEVPASLSLAVMLSSCASGTTCHLVLPAGAYSGDLSLGCVVVEGAGDDTIISGTLSFNRPSVLARVRVEAVYGAVSTTADLLIHEASLLGGYEAVGVSWDEEVNLAICRTRMGAGYSAVNQGWRSRRATVAGSSIASCYEGVGINWGSSELHLSQCVVLADYSAVHIHQSRSVAVIGNVLFGGYEAVGVSNPGAGYEDEYSVQVTSVLVQGNDVRGGPLPESDPEHNIVVR